MWNNSHYQLSERHCKVCNVLYTPKQWRTRSLYCSEKCSNFYYNSKKSRIVDPKKIQCAICWRYFTKPWAHVVQYHGITARTYRKQFGFDVKRWQVTEEHRELLAEHVFSNGTIDNLKIWEVYRFKKWQPIPKYTRSEQTLERLRTQPQVFKSKK